MNKAQCVLTETPLELVTSVVGPGGDLDDCLTHAQSRADGKIHSRNVEVNNEINSGRGLLGCLLEIHGAIFFDDREHRQRVTSLGTKLLKRPDFHECFRNTTCSS